MLAFDFKARCLSRSHFASSVPCSCFPKPWLVMHDLWVFFIGKLLLIKLFKNKRDDGPKWKHCNGHLRHPPHRQIAAARHEGLHQGRAEAVGGPAGHLAEDGEAELLLQLSIQSRGGDHQRPRRDPHSARRRTSRGAGSLLCPFLKTWLRGSPHADDGDGARPTIMEQLGQLMEQNAEAGLADA
jgi:hypothetical protein